MGESRDRGEAGLHVWEVLWNPTTEGVMLFVAFPGTIVLCRPQGTTCGGWRCTVWGWELKTNQLWHGGQSLGLYPRKRRRSHSENVDFKPQSSASPETKEAEAPLPIPERVLLVLDADAGTLGFVVDGSFLGVAFKDLPRDPPALMHYVDFQFDVI
ncbi:hypothetical protein INR49_002878 [Caranx melampygus]|nr:hypothetical protein INR49_002878 [Caranx melampygus]